MGLLDRIRANDPNWPDMVYCGNCKSWGTHFSSSCPKYKPTVPASDDYSQTNAALHDDLEGIVDFIRGLEKDWNEDIRRGFVRPRSCDVDTQSRRVLQSVASHSRRPQPMRVNLKDGDYFEIDGEIKGSLIFDEAVGWRNTGRVVQLAVEHGFKLEDSEKAELDKFMEGEAQDIDIVYELCDSAVQYLDDQIIEPGWSFGWNDGNFFLGHEDWWSET